MGEAYENGDPLAFGLNALQAGIGYRSLSTRGIGGYRLDFSGGHATANMGGFGGVRIARMSFDLQPRGRQYGIAPHGRQPKPRDPLQSHHIIQNEWAKANLANYDPDEALSVLLPKGNAGHSIITTRQNARRAARAAGGQGKWATSLREESEDAAGDLRAAGVAEEIRRRALKRAYKFFYALTP
jgi:hypothetical protein